MKKYFINLLMIFIFSVSIELKSQAVQFNVVVLPVNILSVCNNYFCFPDASEIIANDVINNLNDYKNISALTLSEVRYKLNGSSSLKYSVNNLLEKYSSGEKIDFVELKNVANAFNVKSILLLDCYALNDKTNVRRNLWDILEITSAFQIRYPIEFKTNAVLTDCVNSVVMWSGKYSKVVSDNEGYFSASSQIQAYSQLEKIREYSKFNVSQNISQNVFMRFFPREVRTFFVKPSDDKNSDAKFMPNALEHLANPHMQKEFDKYNFETQNSVDDFIFEF